MNQEPVAPMPAQENGYYLLANMLVLVSRKAHKHHS